MKYLCSATFAADRRITTALARPQDLLSEAKQNERMPAHTCISPHNQVMDVRTGKCVKVKLLRGFCCCHQQLQRAFGLSCTQRMSSETVTTSHLSLKYNFPWEMQLLYVEGMRFPGSSRQSEFC